MLLAAYTSKNPMPRFPARFPAAVTLLLAGCGAPPTSHAVLDAPPAIAASVALPAPVASDAAPPIASASSAPPVEAAPPPPETPRAELLTACEEARSIVVHKAARILELRCGEALAARYEVSLGFAPEGHKAHEGDGKTPEGEYFISMKFPSRFHRSLQIAYPNVADADAGLAAGTIDRAQRDAIARAYATCHEPPQTTALGSLLQIHGGGGGPDVGDWTLGCVAVDNEEIEKVFAFQKPGCDASNRPLTVVRILP